jgi:REP element-mobilizing transposase RayT
MARALRVEYEGARYHVMCRGNQQRDIFLNQEDVDLFLKSLAEVCTRNEVRVHSWCLMSNHYHLLLETPKGNLVDAMKWFQGTFTQRYNARHKLWGHLFQGRYKAKVVDDKDSSYFRKVSEYIHLNPAEAGLVEPGAGRSYIWSS